MLKLVEENKNKSLLLFVVFALLALCSSFLLFFTKVEVNAGLWLPIVGAACVAFGFFAFQAIFFRREVNIDSQGVTIRLYTFGNQIQQETLALRDFKGLFLKWRFSSLFILNLWPRAKLTLILEHENPSKSVVLLQQNSKLTIEEMRKKASAIQHTLGLEDLVDESAAASV